MTKIDAQNDIKNVIRLNGTNQITANSLQRVLLENILPLSNQNDNVTIGGSNPVTIGTNGTVNINGRVNIGGNGTVEIVTDGGGAIRIGGNVNIGTNGGGSVTIGSNGTIDISGKVNIGGDDVNSVEIGSKSFVTIGGTAFKTDGSRSKIQIGTMNNDVTIGGNGTVEIGTDGSGAVNIGGSVIIGANVQIANGYGEEVPVSGVTIGNSVRIGGYYNSEAKINIGGGDSVVTIGTNGTVNIGAGVNIGVSYNPIYNNYVEIGGTGTSDRTDLNSGPYVKIGGYGYRSFVNIGGVGSDCNIHIGGEGTRSSIHIGGDGPITIGGNVTIDDNVTIGGNVKIPENFEIETSTNGIKLRTIIGDKYYETFLNYNNSGSIGIGNTPASGDPFIGNIGSDIENRD